MSDSTQAPSERLAGADSRRAPRLVAQIFSWSGVAPLGFFLVVHLAMTASALRGVRAFSRVVDVLHATPALPLLESLVVFAPLVFHGALGAWLVASRRSLAPAPYAAGWQTAMRFTGVVVLAFLAIHVPELRFAERGARLGGGELATLLDADLSATASGVPWRGVAYLAGAAAVCFHFACGLWAAFARARVEASQARRRRHAAWAAGALAAFLWFAFADVVVLHATGSRLVGGALGSEAIEPSPTGCAP